MWSHIRGPARKRSCRSVFDLLASTENQEELYHELAVVLKRDGPFAPAFEGFDPLQNPSYIEYNGQYNSSGVDSECVLAVSTEQSNGRESLIAVTRTHVGASMVERVDPTFTFMPTDGTAGGYGGSVLSADGKHVYFIPRNADNIGVLDVFTEQFTTINISSHINTTDKYSGDVLGSNGKVYCVPYNAANIGVFDPVALSFDMIPIPPAGAAQYSQGLLAPDGRIYFVPEKDPGFGAFDPSTGIFEHFLIEASLRVSFAAGYLTEDGYIYCLPDRTSHVDTTFGKFHIASKILSWVSLPDAGLTRQDTYASMVFANGDLYFVPSYADKIVIFNIEAQSTHSISIEHKVYTHNVHNYYGQSVWTTLGDEWKYNGGVVGPAGTVYFILDNSNDIGELDLFAGTFTVHFLHTGTDLDHKFAGAVVAANGVIYMTPFNAIGIGKFSVAFEIAQTHLYDYLAHAVTALLVKNAIDGHIAPALPEADFLRTASKMPIVYDFANHATTLATWKSYAELTAYATNHIARMTDGAVYTPDSRFSTYLEYSLTSGYNRILVCFANLGTSGSVAVKLNSYLVAQAFAGQGVQTYVGTFTAGQSLEIYTVDTDSRIGVALYI